MIVLGLDLGIKVQHVCEHVDCGLLRSYLGRLCVACFAHYPVDFGCAEQVLAMQIKASILLLAVILLILHDLRSVSGILSCCAESEHHHTR